MPRKNPFKSSGINEITTNLKTDKKIVETVVKENPKKELEAKDSGYAILEDGKLVKLSDNGQGIKHAEEVAVQGPKHDDIAEILAQLRVELDEPESGI